MLTDHSHYKLHKHPLEIYNKIEREERHGEEIKKGKRERERERKKRGESERS
jgi:hypothetical protein